MTRAVESVLQECSLTKLAPSEYTGISPDHSHTILKDSRQKLQPVSRNVSNKQRLKR